MDRQNAALSILWRAVAALCCNPVGTSLKHIESCMILKILVGIWVFPSTCMSYAAEDLLQAYTAALTNDPRFGNAHYEYEAAKEAIPQARADH